MAALTGLVLLASSVALAPAERLVARQMRNDDLDLQPANHTTGQGCTCSSTCSGDALGYWYCDWCHTSNQCGDWRLGTGYYDWCDYKPPDAFATLSADAKMAALWEKIVADRSVQEQLSKAGTLLEVVKLSMVTTMDSTMEVLPAGRRKVLHVQGVIAQLDLEVESGSPYTGMLAPGTHKGMIRLGSAFPPTIDTFPGFALKFLRSGIHSANTMVLRHNGNGTGQLQFFEEPLSNHVSPPPVLAALGKFAQATGCQAMTGLSDFCEYNQDGSWVSSPVFPYEIQFDAPDRSQFPIDTRAPDPDAEVLRALSTIPPGTHLYNLWAKATPSSAFVRIGKVVTKSAATTSMFADSQLFFRHTRMEYDFLKRPEWIEPAKDHAFCDESATEVMGNLKPLSTWQCPGVDGVPPA